MIRKNIPNFITLCNLICGCIAIVFALEGNLIWCAYMVVFAAICDLLDGMVARMLKVSSELGKQLDSLADVVSFGVVPGVLLYKMIIYTQTFVYFNTDLFGFISNHSVLGKEINYLAMTGFLVTVFSAIRLAKFNIDSRQTNLFIGLPTPANAILIASLPLSIPESLTDMLRPTGQFTVEQISSFGSVVNEKNNIYEILLQPHSVIALTLISSFLLVAPLPLFAFKFKNFSWEDNKIRYIFLFLTIPLLLIFKFLGIPLIIILYIALSLMNKLMTRKLTN